MATNFDPGSLVPNAPVHAFAIPRLGSRGGTGQKSQIEKMRVLAERMGGQFTVVSDDWSWLYLAP
ncbi:MAG: hypothetical protein FJ267_09170 [Planctomycetes bacterium]|nr:hypothetical protein [Planctomycetota bacterium]